MKTNISRVNVSLDDMSISALDRIAADLQRTGQRGDRSSCIRYAIIRTARALADLSPISP